MNTLPGIEQVLLAEGSIGEYNRFTVALKRRNFGEAGENSEHVRSSPHPEDVDRRQERPPLKINVDDSALDPVATLTVALDAWRKQGRSAPLIRWLSRELDDAGSPIRLSLSDWTAALQSLASAAGDRPGWPVEIDGRLTDFVRMLLRFSRPDGRPAALDGAPESAKVVRASWKAIARAFPADDIGRVLDWWFPGEDIEPSPPPLPAWSSTDRVLAILRADWTSRGDFIAIDQRDSRATRFELFGSGIPWLGPAWSNPEGIGDGRPAEAGIMAWATNSSADVVEWEFQAAGRRVTRIALMLRGRRIALLGDQIDGLAETDAPESAVSVPEGLSVGTIPDAPGAFQIKPTSTGRSARAIPLGRGSMTFDADSRKLIARHARGATASWMPMVFAWDHARNRKPLRWNALTVAEEGRACPPDAAWAARVSWGGGDTFVFYRSLGPVTRRSFLGCSTTARFLAGRFTPEGDVEPIVTLN